MKKIIILLPLMALSSAAQASTSYGALSNFDVVNDTGQICYGFEIEIDDVHSTAIGGTYSYNHYGVPKIREDNSDPAHPKVFVRYEVTKPSGLDTGMAAGKTLPAPPPGSPGSISPTNGHSCTNPSVNQGCEHFGVGIYSSSYTAVKYNWLIKDGVGNLTTGPAVNVGTPVWTYQPPVVVQPDPNLPPIVQFQAQVVAVIPAPIVPQPQPKEFGEPSWVKVIKTKSHNIKPIPLEDLVGDYEDENGVHPLKNWRNGEPPEAEEVESEWYLLQTNSKGNGKSELEGQPDKMGDNGEETVTRRYEFYAYEGNDLSIDGENGEAMCDTVAADNSHGSGFVSVTDANGESYDFDCSSDVVVGEYRGSQMGAFNAAAPFALIDNLQESGNVAKPFPGRTIPIGGNTPYVTTFSPPGALPKGLTIDSTTGVLSGTPSKVGVFNFNVSATDSDGTHDSKSYTIKVTGPGDVDVDSDIDLADLAAIKAKNGQAAAADNPADVNHDLKINILDYRKAATLCTLPQCALITPPAP